ncbi:MAG TPA: hypothetical protein VFD31_10690 [Thermoleophilaceae bacterium]|nr:hypothetical protein [Thermoleophilaceae bacterium]
MSGLPFIDEHALAVDAPRERVWQALLEVTPAGLEGRGPATFARLLGCEPATSSGPRPIDVGSTIPGFAVTEAQRGSRLVLSGRHRFSCYELVFTLREDARSGTRLGAETWAVFPGIHGRAYRAAVIGTRGHVVMVRRMLAAVARRASSIAPP